MSEPHSFTEILEKAARFCAYQMRCEQDVRKKLQRLNCSPKDTAEVICRLREEGFLDEARFADTFVRSYFEGKKWGKQKIMHALNTKNVDKTHILRAMEQIDNASYTEMLAGLMRKKKQTLAGKCKTPTEIRLKTWRYARSKGYAHGLIADVWKDLEEEDK